MVACCPNCKTKFKVPNGTLDERFWQAVQCGNTDECWPWLGGTKGNGYGSFTRNGVGTSAHRIAWILTNGEIAPELVVCHRCDNPACCNPAHLFAATQKANLLDMRNKGRGNSCKGENKPLAKLTEGQVSEIIKRMSAGESQRSLAMEFGVSHSTVHAISKKKAWRHVA